MRVGIDGFNLALAQGSGVATYARTLAEAVSGLGVPIDLIYGLDVPPSSVPDRRETLFFSALAEGRSGGEAPERTSLKGKLQAWLPGKAPLALVEVPRTGRVVRQGIAATVPAHDRLFTRHRLFYRGRKYLERHGTLMPVRVADPPSIMHWTYPVPVRMVGARNVYTIHDLVPLRLPYLSRENKAYHETLLTECIAAAVHIATVSETSRRDILAWLPAVAHRVTNLGQAVRSRFMPSIDGHAEDERLAALFDLEPQGYFLFYGAIEPKKNVGRLIEAYLAAGLETKLVIVGASAWEAAEELRVLNGAHGTVLDRARRVRRIDYLPIEQLGIVVRGARAVVFPSLYEGFGLPAVEAMCAGIPVIAGAAGALPEILGETAMLVDPYDVAAIRDALIEIDRNPGLRAALSAAGKRRAPEFALEPYQARIQDLYTRLLRDEP